ncbi:N-acyl-D-amino-acid deacylase family protein [Lignipirellula cremea]|uniref:N-acyl-D-glutamate deacylase n=1 Tax=Lignipirellula cremea TaxID=2528010 RepID=A0A518DTK7_9BACT|nr:D-aminoacylase [Lignipirellula cremea]QDU95138.1 N-acyl-D-glutamate deacylase [Lignipirellula cremea]
MHFETLLRDVWVIDGGGGPRYRADIGLQGDRIAAIGDLSEAVGQEEIQGGGRVVCPGLIDPHNHSEGWLLRWGHLPFKTRQGFTTEVLMSDGISYAPVTPATAPHWMHYLRPLNGLLPGDYRGWRSVDDYLQQFNLRENRIAQNVIAQVPYANVRTAVKGWSGAAPTGDEMREIQAMISRAMEQGAVGLSTGLDYVAECFASTEELIAACQALRPFNGLYVTHIRYRLGTAAGIDEAVEIAQRAGVRLHISHLKAETPDLVEPVLQAIERARETVDFSFDCYPYAWASTMLSMMLPYEVWENGPLAAGDHLASPAVQQALRARFDQPRFSPENIYIAWLASETNAGHIGSTLAQYAGAVDLPVEQAACRLLAEESFAVSLVFPRGSDAVVDPFLQHPCSMLGSDGIYAQGGRIHPRCFGSAPRFLGPLVRDRKLFSLEQAVRKATSIPAQRFGLAGRGRLQTGAFADLVLFDPETIADRATYTEPYAEPVGIDRVWVNGRAIVIDGQPASLPREELPGRVLRAGQID